MVLLIVNMAINNINARKETGIKMKNLRFPGTPDDNFTCTVY